MRLFITGCVNHEGSERTGLCFRASLCPAKQPSYRILLYSCHSWILFLYQDDGTGFPSCYSITPSSIPANLLQLEGEETKHLPLAKDFEERFLLASQPDDLRKRPSYEFSGPTAEFHLDNWHCHLVVSHLRNGPFLFSEWFPVGKSYPDQTHSRSR